MPLFNIEITETRKIVMCVEADSKDHVERTTDWISGGELSDITITEDRVSEYIKVHEINAGTPQYRVDAEGSLWEHGEIGGLADDDTDEFPREATDEEGLRAVEEAYNPVGRMSETMGQPETVPTYTPTVTTTVAEPVPEPAEEQVAFNRPLLRPPTDLIPDNAGYTPAAQGAREAQAARTPVVVEPTPYTPPVVPGYKKARG